MLACALLLGGVRPTRAAAAALVAGLACLPLFPVSVEDLLAAEASALVLAFEVVLIILGGVLLYQTIAAARADEPLAEWISALSSDRGRIVLLVGLGLTPFAESVTGFGVGIIIAIPLLLKLGFDAVTAAILGLLGLVAVPWGALAPGILVAARLTDLPVEALGVRTAAISLPVFLIVGLATLIVALGLRRAVGKAPELVAIAGVLWGGIWAANLLVGTALAGVLGSLVAIATVTAIIRLREGPLPTPGPDVRRAVAPYALLIGLLLGSRATLAAATEVGLRPDAGSLLDMILYIWVSPATWLLVTCALTPRLLDGVRLSGRNGPLLCAVSRWRPVALTTVAFLLLGGLMTASGMASAIAEGAVSTLGRAYLLAAPWIGGLGGYVTGSNTGANAMLATAQAQAADTLDVSTLNVVATQTAAASLLTMASAPRVALAQSLAGASSTARIYGMILIADAAVLAVGGALLLAWL